MGTRAAVGAGVDVSVAGVLAALADDHDARAIVAALVRTLAERTAARRARR